MAEILGVSDTERVESDSSLDFDQDTVNLEIRRFHLRPWAGP
jgi:hypothetical protein